MGEYVWDFQQPASRGGITDQSVREIQRIFSDGFNLEKAWSFTDVRHRVNTATLLGILRGKSGKAYGYAIYSVPSIALEGTYMLWEDGICIRKEVQGQGLASRLVFQRACSLFPGLKFGWVGGRTQNPVVIWRYHRIGKIFPFDATYGSALGQKLMEYLCQSIVEVGEIKQLDRLHGICRQVYREGRLGDYPLRIEGTETFEEQLSQWRFDRSAGDAVIVVSHLDQPIQM